MSQNFSSQNRLINKNGQQVQLSSNPEFTTYKIISKYQRNFSCTERVGRGFLGVIAVICTLGLALFSKSVRNLFTKPTESIRFAIALSKSSKSDEPNLANNPFSPITHISNIPLPFELPSNPNSFIDTEVNKVFDNIPQPIMNVLNQFFQDSPYPLNDLPIYPMLLDKQEPCVKRNKMTKPLMKGASFDGRPFIAIQLKCNLTDDEITNVSFPKNYTNYPNKNRLLTRVLILGQSCPNGPIAYDEGNNELMWWQIKTSDVISPLFFTWNFTYPDSGTGPTESQKSNFSKVQQLLKIGQSKDLHGLKWHISTAQLDAYRQNIADPSD